MHVVPAILEIDPMSSTVTESALLRAAQAGDRVALGQLLMMQSDMLSRRLERKGF